MPTPWKNKQVRFPLIYALRTELANSPKDKPEDYDVFTKTYSGGPEDGPLSAAVFIEEGRGNITVDGSCHYAAKGGRAWMGGSFEWTAEGGAIVAWVLI